MGIILGIDVGGSTTKVVGLRDGAAIGMLQVRAADQVTSLYGAIGNFLRYRNIGLGEVSSFALTGVGSSFIEEQIYGIETRKVNEFTAIGHGALWLSGLSEALVVSMGTGTAFVRAAKDKSERIGGSGIGGGTIIGLASQMFGKSDIDAILALAKNGKLENVDLLVKDIIGNEIPSLSSNLTAANFGKVKSTASESDIALGVINMVFQTIGMLAVFAMRHDPVRDVVLTGTLTTFPQASTMLEAFSRLSDMTFIIPPNAEFATALGAAHSIKPAL
ncbi:MAG: type II pantothenate kinase [Oscillospiraceae bacterium]|nr:type II pantothenate kinase [Oscillospiraceae bacterium]